MTVTMWLGTDATSPTDFSTAANWSAGSVPVASDDLIFTNSYNNPMTEGVDQGTTAFSSFYVEAGYTAQIGSFESPLISDVSKFDYHGGGVIWVKLGASGGIPVNVTNSGATANGAWGVNIDGDVSTLSVSGGSVAVNVEAGFSGSLTALHSMGGQTVLGSNLTAVTSVDVLGGVVETRESVPTVRVYSGTFKTADAAAITTKLSVYGGDCVLNGTGTIADILLDSDGGSTLDFTQTGISRTVTNIKNNGGVVVYNPNVITFTTDATPDKAVRKAVNNISW